MKKGHSVVARALQREVHFVARAGFEVGECQGPRTGDQPRDAHAPRGLIKAVGLAVVVDKEEVVGRRQPGVECLPLQQVADVSGTGFPGGWSSHGMTSSPGLPGRLAPGLPPAAPSVPPTPHHHPSTRCAEKRFDAPWVTPFHGPVAHLPLRVRGCQATNPASPVSSLCLSPHQIFPSEVFPPALLPCMSWVQGLHRLSTTLSPRRWQRAWQKGMSPQRGKPDTFSANSEYF